MGTFYDTEVERQKKGDTTVNTILPILAALETIATAKATRGQNVGTSTLGLIKDTHSRRADALDRAQKSDNDAFTKNLHIGEAARASKRFALDEAQGKREAMRYDREIQDDGEKKNAKLIAIDRLRGIPNEYDEKTNTVTRSGVPGVPGLTVEDEVAIGLDPIAWLTNKLKPQATQLVIGNDGTYQPVNKATGLTPSGNQVVARPQVDPFGTQLMVGAGGVVTPVSKKTGLGPDGKPVVTVAGDKPATEDQSKAATFGRRMELSMSQLGDIEKTGYNPTTSENAARNSKWAPNFLNTGDGQQYENAKKNWIRANLRKESGAVIGDQEMADEMSVYFPVHGDLPETVAQKSLLRAQAFEGMKAAAGKQFEKIPSMIPAKAPTPSDAVNNAFPAPKVAAPSAAPQDKKALAQEALNDPEAPENVKAAARKYLAENP